MISWLKGNAEAQSQGTFGFASMAYDSRVYRVLIASPSDVEEEREIAVRVIQEWNDLYSYSRKVVLLPLRWETHTAPEYGTRPQEVINRAIVDECDLLVGIFWTRIGSPTGIADSGTLEEIERVGTAGKPIMLYFSAVGIDPERIEVSQIERLRSFKQKAYPKGLNENYKSIIEFRDKFARQLELKVKDLQRGDPAEHIPLSLEFLSIDTGKPIGNTLTDSFEYPMVSDFTNVPPEDQDKIKETTSERTKQHLYRPFILAIRNASAAGIRDLFVELKFHSNIGSLELVESLPFQQSSLFAASRWLSFTSPGTLYTTDQGFISEEMSEVLSKARQTIAKFEARGLHKDDVSGDWSLSFEWDAIQPQRLRPITPILYTQTNYSAELLITAKVFSDTLPGPFEINATVRIEPKARLVRLEALFPDWERLIDARSKGERRGPASVSGSGRRPRSATTALK